ncbi:hypothetical protein FOL47_006361 [Perkinsus chesapeaki]|uniref:MIF4G domain-containing protein n=1 Tax=Perkinsus chesapeaki TaxID=330153 RepID=A0A7J6LSN7_PERCH|nr:hypothetical protein FOL47_006361 [Perkinsus chesapeaki]
MSSSSSDDSETDISYDQLEEALEHVYLMYDHLWCRARVFESKAMEVSAVVNRIYQTGMTDDNAAQLFTKARNALLARKELVSMPRDPLSPANSRCPHRAGEGKTQKDGNTDAAGWTLIRMMEETIPPALGQLLQFEDSGTLPGVVPLDTVPPPPPRSPSRRAGLRLHRLKRKIRTLLNKVAENNITRTAEELAKLEIHTRLVSDLLIVSTVRRAIQEPIFTEVYAKLLLEFRSQAIPVDGVLNFDRVVFRDMLVTEVHRQFAEVLVDFDLIFNKNICKGDADFACAREARRQEAFQCMRLLGIFFRTGLFTVETLKRVAGSLVFRPSATPTPFEIECAVKLLEATGMQLDSGDDRCRGFCSCLLGRLVHLKESITEGRLRMMILNLEKAREGRWKRTKTTGASREVESVKDTVKPVLKKKKAHGRSGHKPIEVFSEEGFRTIRDMYQDDGSLERFMAQAVAMATHDRSCVRSMVELLLSWGPTTHRKKKSKEADLIVEMVRWGVVSFELLYETLTAFMQDIDERSPLSAPTYEFIQKVYAQLLTAEYDAPEGPESFDSALFLSWEALHSESKAFDLGLGILQNVKDIAGLEGVRRSLAALQPVVGQMHAAESISDDADGFWDPLLDDELEAPCSVAPPIDS